MNECLFQPPIVNLQIALIYYLIPDAFRDMPYHHRAIIVLLHCCLQNVSGKWKWLLNFAKKCAHCAHTSVCS